MSDSEDYSQVSSSIFKSKDCSNSVFFEDKEMAEELSNIILSDVNPGDKAKNLQELNEKNELKSAYLKQESLSPQAIKESYNLNNIKTKDSQLKSNLSPQNYEKIKSNEMKEEDDIFLKIEDFPENPISEIFIYEQVIDKIRPMISSIEAELKVIDFDNKSIIKNYKAHERPVAGIEKIKTHKKKESAEFKNLKKQKGINDEFLDIYGKYCETFKDLSTYGQQYIDSINPATGRIHTTFWQLGADTGY